MEQSKTICINGELTDFSVPKVMGIINATPDSFYPGSRAMLPAEIAARANRLLEEGADWLDIGGYSSRPGCCDISPETEYSRLATALEQVRMLKPDCIISVDTFRASIARKCVEVWGVQIINDISGGRIDPEMPDTIASLGVTYILMHMRGTPENMTRLTEYNDVTADVISDLSFNISDLRQRGVADIIVDPGFGFAKTTEQNFTLLRNLKDFHILGCPVLAGISRKSMIWRTLGCTPEESLNGTTVLNTIALERGASVLRVHDVKAARQAVMLVKALNN